MVLTFAEEKELLELKLSQKKEIIELESNTRIAEHDEKMLRLGKLLEIAQAGGVKQQDGV